MREPWYSVLKLLVVVLGLATSHSLMMFYFLFTGNVVEPLRLDKENYYYHRQYRRIPGIDECDVGDEVCVFEVNKQFKRDKYVSLTSLHLFRILHQFRAWYISVHSYETFWFFCRLVDSEILNILRQRKLECQTYYGKDKNKYCAKEINDYEDAATNFFIRCESVCQVIAFSVLSFDWFYWDVIIPDGDLGAGGTVIDAYMKQKHRMIWERRHGPVGGQAQVVEWNAPT